MHKFLFYNFQHYCAHHQEVKTVLYSIWYRHTLYVAVRCTTWLLYTADSFLNNTLHFCGTVDSRFSESRLFKFPFCPSLCVVVKADSMMGTNNSAEVRYVRCLCARRCLSGFTGMRRITTFRSTTDRIYDGGSTRL